MSSRGDGGVPKGDQGGVDDREAAVGEGGADGEEGESQVGVAVVGDGGEDDGDAGIASAASGGGSSLGARTTADASVEGAVAGAEAMADSHLSAKISLHIRCR